MSNPISILIVDDNIEYCSVLNEYISQHYDMNVVGMAKDGMEALEQIINLKPKIVILDIIMPNLDGIGVLEKLSEVSLEERPLFIVLSAIGQDVFIQKAVSLGAEYYIVKPFDVDILVSRIRQIYQEKNSSPFSHDKLRIKAPAKNQKDDKLETTPEMLVTELVQSAGILPHIPGYQYIREAIMMNIQDNAVFSSITKVIYPIIAEKHKTTSRKVERAIRCAIDTAWNKGRLSRFNDDTRFFRNFDNSKPTNSQFIFTLADKARLGLEMKQNKENVN